ncbi:MAG: CoA-binding protein [Candidatus Aenigmatarchaeota archaeon]
MTIKTFFNPDSVAIVGASRNQQKPGHVIFRNFLDSGYAGKLYPVNPNADEIMGVKCYPNLAKIPGSVELAVIVVPAEMVPEALNDCGQKGVKGAVIISGGFREIGNYELEKKVKDVAKKHGIRVIGPNCIGLFDPSSGVDMIFNPSYKLTRPKAGGISFISQSGAVMSAVMDWMGSKGYKASKFASYGNASDVNEAELIEWLGKDPATKVICLYLEGTSDGRKFFETARKVSKIKPIIALKSGVTEAGGHSVASHTGSLAGQAEAYVAAFRQAGVIEAADLENIFDLARVLSTQPLPKGPKVQVITDGGGFGVLATDFIIKNELHMAQMNVKTVENLKKTVPSYVVIKNPIDLTGNATPKMYGDTIKAAMEDNNVDMIVVIALFQTPLLTPEVVDIIEEIASTRKKPLIVVAAGGEYTEVLKKDLEEKNIPTFSSTKSAVGTLASLWSYSQDKKCL